jgi:hypothetical protein
MGIKGWEVEKEEGEGEGGNNFGREVWMSRETCYISSAFMLSIAFWKVGREEQGVGSAMQQVSIAIEEMIRVLG